MGLANYKGFLVLFFVVSVIGFNVNAQDFSLSEIKFYQNELEIKNALAGGLNSPQFNAIDINLDGKDDLLVFDRVGNVSLPFINNSSIPGEVNYQYDPSYKSIFNGLKNWVRVRDYNGDMIPDIFSSGNIPGCEVRRGYIEEGKLNFEKISFWQGAEDVIYYELSGGGWTQIFVANGDLPEFIDIDKDGDLDILTFEPNGGNYVYFWSNQAIEQGLSLDSLVFENIDFCFGKFKESGVSQEITLSTDPENCSEGLWEDEVEIRHDGSTITAFDKNDDGLWDVLIGDLTSPNIVYLQNGGSAESAWMTELDDNFPRANIPVDINTFNSAFYVDVDNDTKKDILVAPNYRTASAENYNCSWYYRDVNIVGPAEYSFQKDVFLVDEMIDMGAGSNPAFTDYNSDGLLDIVVGSVGFYDPLGSKIARLYLFENQGTLTAPEFALVDEDYLEFSQFNSTSNNYAPSFGDLDGDGDHDLVIGDNKGALYYLENTAGVGNTYDFENPIYQYMDIDIGENSKPQLIDINNDGLMDLVIGERNGNPGPDDLNYAINYFQNTGTENDPFFNPDPNVSPNNPILGIVNTRDFGFSTPSTSPYFVYLPEKEDFILFCGSESGRIKVYENIVENFDGAFDQTSEEFGGFWEGKRSTLASADIDSDGFLELLIGNERGGLTLVNTPIVFNSSVPTLDIDQSHDFSIYPNPANKNVTIDINPYKGGNWQIVISDIVGKEVHKTWSNGESTVFDVGTFPEGVYIISISQEHALYSKKIVISH